ncbi:MAG: hypothetical protein AAFV85_28040, partial [Cyanobacteria bacterium J06634_6]
FSYLREKVVMFSDISFGDDDFNRNNNNKPFARSNESNEKEISENMARDKHEPIKEVEEKLSETKEKKSETESRREVNTREKNGSLEEKSTEKSQEMVSRLDGENDVKQKQ